MSNVFYWILNMSIISSITGLVVLLLTRIPKVPKRISVFLWIVPFFRMTVPIGFNSKLSLMSIIKEFVRKVDVYSPTEHISFSEINSVQAAESYYPFVYKEKALEQIFTIASVVWLSVFCAMVITLLVLYITTLRETKDSVHFEDNIYFSEKINSPAVYGIIRPRIILPQSFEGKNNSYIISHEKMHIRRLDNLWRMIAFFITAAHWFNPLAWVFLKMFLADIELSCDECVISKLDKVNTKEYALSLLQSKNNTNVFVSAFGGAKIRTRIENILSFKKLTIFSVSGFILLAVSIAFVLLTNSGT